MNLSSKNHFSSFRRALEKTPRPISVTGTTAPPYFAHLASQDILPSPTLFVTPTEKMALEFATDLKNLSGKTRGYVLEAFDETPYSGLYPSPRCLFSRMKFFWNARNNEPGSVFISSIDGLMTPTFPVKLFSENVITLTKGEEVDLDLLSEQLVRMGYQPSPLVEDGGTFSRRGDIFDIFSPSHDDPIRLEFFGSTIEEVRFFNRDSQRSTGEQETISICPTREILLFEEVLQRGYKSIKEFCDRYEIPKKNRDNLTAPLEQSILPNGIDYWMAHFYEKPSSVLDYFRQKPTIVWLDDVEITKANDHFGESAKEGFKKALERKEPAPDISPQYEKLNWIREAYLQNSISVNAVDMGDSQSENSISIKTLDTSELKTVVQGAREAKKDFFLPAVDRITEWKKEGMTVFFFASSQSQAKRTQYLFENHGITAQETSDSHIDWGQCVQQQQQQENLIHLIPRPLSQSGRYIDDQLVFIRDEDLYGKRVHREVRKQTQRKNLAATGFGDFNAGDFVVHTLHGVGNYEGLNKLDVQGVEQEFLTLKYRDNDKLYMPIYRISQVQKYSGPGGSVIVDKLGGTSWQKAKTKVRNSVRDLASELLNIYAQRKLQSGFSYSEPDDEFREFENTFPFDETVDQAKAIDDVLGDMVKEQPMDRLVCGDVGFGKTEVAVRAAYKAVQDGKQVAILVPTTVLAFQHFQTFKKRMDKTAVQVSMVSRFVKPAQVKKELEKLKEGKIDILIGTHRLISQDVKFKSLGLLVIDEEQRFGVAQKEKIKKLKTTVDVLTLSATPIPRTLNMSLMGIRDLSLINTPPESRLSVRTFILRHDHGVLRKAIMSEINRGGQVYIIHNKVQSIEYYAKELRDIVPDADIRVGHGQMKDEALEKTMVDFYNKEFNVLLCTTIIENGLDIPSANTIIIDRADTFGLSQLYQLRGRVGRSKERAYCYLMIPPQGVVDKVAQERLKILQENSELGSGYHIAHHDLELRGSGNILGENQSGHIATVGYELYMDLLEQAIGEAKGEVVEEDLEPEINLRIPALIPDSYIEDIRIRLSYYKLLGGIKDEEDLDAIEQELSDRFGPLPEQVTNLFGVMIIRKFCKDLGIKDISKGPTNLSLSFSEITRVKPDAVVQLAMKSSKKFTLSPDQKLIIKMKNDGWAPILEELKHLKRSLL